MFLFDFYNEYAGMKIREYKFYYPEKRFAKEMAAYMYNGYILFTATLSGDNPNITFASMMLFGFGNGTDHEIDISPYLMDTGYYVNSNNLYDYLRGSVMIVPIFAGSGIRMKILEAAKMRIPFISTSVGNSGLFFETEKDCLIADDSIAFVKAVFKMENVQFRRKTTESAYKVFVSNYSFY